MVDGGNMIKFGKEEPFIKPKGIKFKSWQDENVKLPKVAVGVFSKMLFKDIVEKFNCKEIGYIHYVNLDKPVYMLNYKGTMLTLFLAGVAGPAIASDIEELHAQGIEKFVIYGNCGVLDSKIKDCSIIIPSRAYREEGTSYHYVPESEFIEVNPKYKEEFIKILEDNKFDYTIGSTWTTDAFYRETVDKIKYFQSLDVKTVEMEGATIAAVCKYLEIDYFTFYYAGDNLDSVKWEERSLHEATNFDKKQKVTILALEIAKEMSKE